MRVVYHTGVSICVVYHTGVLMRVVIDIVDCIRANLQRCFYNS